MKLLKKELKKILSEVFVEKFKKNDSAPYNYLSPQFDWNWYHANANNSITLYHWIIKDEFYHFYTRSDYPGENAFEELETWYRIIGGRYKGKWIGKQLIKSYCDEIINKGFSKFISSIEINTSEIMRAEIRRFDDMQIPVCYPYKDKNCFITIELNSNIPKKFYDIINKKEIQNDILRNICIDFILTKEQTNFTVRKRSPEDRYRVVANKRKDKVIESIRSFSRLESEKNKRNYNFDSAETQKVHSEMIKEMYGEFSNKIIWWKCDDCGHSYSMSIANKTKGRGCLLCKKSLKVQDKRNDELKSKDLVRLIKQQEKLISTLNNTISELNETITKINSKKRSTNIVPRKEK